MEQILTIRSALRSGHHNGTIINKSGLTLDEGVMGETGKVELVDTIDKGVSATIQFKKEYKNPVVIVYVITRTVNKSVEARVKDVTTKNCTIFMENPEDAAHGKEFIGYLVLESGSHITATGYRIEVGKVTTTNARRSTSTNFKGDYVKFGKLFTQTPVVLHSLNTYRGATFATSMVQNVTTDGFEIAQELAETNKASANEEIAWIALEPMKGISNISGVKCEVGLIKANEGTSIENTKDVTIQFKSGFTNRPDVIVKGQTMNIPDGLTTNDGYWARGSGAWSKDMIKVYAEEDQKTDSERTHNAETFGYAAFEQNSIIKVVNPVADRISDIFDLSDLVVKGPLITTWKTNNYSKVAVFVKVSSNFGIRWGDWLPCAYSKVIPGLPLGGDLSGYNIQFKFEVISDINLIPVLEEFTIEADGKLVLIEGLNVGGYAYDGSDWNSKKIM